MLNKEQILQAKDARTERVEIPEWGGYVFVRMMSARQRDQFEAEQVSDPYKDIRARLAVHTVCDEQGEMLFTMADVEALSQKSAAALDRIFAAAVKLNRISKEDIDELEKNSTAAR